MWSTLGELTKATFTRRDICPFFWAATKDTGQRPWHDATNPGQRVVCGLTNSFCIVLSYTEVYQLVLGLSHFCVLGFFNQDQKPMERYRDIGGFLKSDLKSRKSQKPNS